MRKLLCLLLASFFIYSCEKDEPTGINEFDKLIQPLKVGYSWTFIDSTFSDEGTFTKVDTSTVSVIGSEIANFNGKEIELFYWQWDFIDKIWLVTHNHGDHIVYGLREDNKNYLVSLSLIIPYPINIGDSWKKYNFDLKKNNDETYDVIIDTLEYECLYKDFQFKTIIGELECIVTINSKQLGNEIRETYTYYCPNIGYVGLENKVNNILTFKKTLMNYNFSGKQDLPKISKSALSRNKNSLISDIFGLRN